MRFLTIHFEMNEGIKELPIEFIGRGEVKGFQFRQLMKGNRMFMYEVTSDGITHYEVFEIRACLTPITREPYVGYPKANSFGVWAWAYRNYEKAIIKFNEMNNYASQCN